MAIEILNGNKAFKISDANPFRFVELTTPDVRYKTKPFQKDYSSCYKQPFIADDATVFQVLSDWAFTVRVFFAYTGIQKQVYSAIDKGAILVGYTMHVYDVPIDFDLYDNGVYFIEIVFTDDNSVVHTVTSEPFEIGDHEDSVLLEYTNSRNDFGIIFSSDTYIPSLRVYAAILNYQPDFVDANFVDQGQDVTLLDSEPFRKFDFNIIMAADWMVDKINYIVACDQWSADGEFYQKDEGAKWEVQRAEPDKTNLKKVVNAKIMIRPAENADDIEYQVGDNDSGGDEIYDRRKTMKFDNNGIDLAIPDTFKDKVILEFITIQQNGTPEIITLKIGTSLGGDEIYEEVTFSNPDKLIRLDKLFTSIETLYIMGLAGHNTDVRIVYYDANALPLNPVGYATLGVPIGSNIYYKFKDQPTFELDFDLDTGYGRAGREFVDYQLDLTGAGKFKVSYDGATYLGATTGGSANITIAKTNLPNVGIPVFAAHGNNATGDVPTPTSHIARVRNDSSAFRYEINKAPDNPALFNESPNTWLGKGAPLGDGTPINSLPPFAVGIEITRYQRTTN